MTLERICGEAFELNIAIEKTGFKTLMFWCRSLHFGCQERAWIPGINLLLVLPPGRGGVMHLSLGCTITKHLARQAHEIFSLGSKMMV